MGTTELEPFPRFLVESHIQELGSTVASFSASRADKQDARMKRKYRRDYGLLHAYARFIQLSTRALLLTFLQTPALILTCPWLVVKSVFYYCALQFVGMLVLLIEVFRFLGLINLATVILQDFNESEQLWSIMNTGYETMFNNCPDVVARAKESFSQGEEHVSGSREADLAKRRRYFNLDMAKAMLLMSAILYERDEGLVGQARMEEYPEQTVCKAYERIMRQADYWGMKFAPISNLNTYGGAYCGLFWDPTSNWIVIAFKGSAPMSGRDWLVDMTLSKVNAEAFLFGEVNQGIYDMLFTDSESRVHFCPYGEIITKVNKLAKKLSTERQEHVNVFVTGHSMGSAVATTFFARAMKCPKDFHEAAKMRNAYVFGSPRIGDTDFCAGFYGEINTPFGNEHMLYRVINDKDIMCSVPLGDVDNPTIRSYMQKNWIANYGHVGEPIKLNGNYRPVLPGNSFAPGFEVIIVQKELGERSKCYQIEESVWVIFLKMFVPRMLSDHLPGAYMDKLEKIAADMER